MNVKISIELSERQAEFIERKVREGAYASPSDFFAEQVRDVMLAENDASAVDDPVLAMKDEILRRLQSPDEDWLSEEEFDKEFEQLLRHADEQIKAGR